MPPNVLFVLIYFILFCHVTFDFTDVCAVANSFRRPVMMLGNFCIFLCQTFWTGSGEKSSAEGLARSSRGSGRSRWKL